LVIAAVAVVGVACAGSGAGSSATTAHSGGSGAGMPAMDQSGGSSGSQPKAAQPPGQNATTSNLEVPAPAEGPKVVRTGRLTLQVPNGSFSDKLDELGAAVRLYKGYVSGSDSQTPESGSLRVATITYQIPSESFDDALARIRRLGTMQSINLTGQDVSSQYVDLQARLKVQEQQRDFYLSLLGQAKTTADLITIRNQLAPVLDQIERLKGQIGYLEHATTYATLSVMLREAAAGIQPANDSWGFQSSLLQAARLFVNTLNWVVIGIGAAGPFLLLGIPLFLLIWRRRPRRAVAPSLP
jgi:hypothetical protein